MGCDVWCLGGRRQLGRAAGAPKNLVLWVRGVACTCTSHTHTSAPPPQELAINPAAQDLDPFNWVLAWEGLLAGHQMAALLEQVSYEARLPCTRNSAVACMCTCACVHTVSYLDLG